MRKLKSFALIVFATLVVASVQTAALGQTANDGKLATVSGGGSSIRALDGTSTLRTLA